jgi:hypothetical protein
MKIILILITLGLILTTYFSIENAREDKDEQKRP